METLTLTPQKAAFQASSRLRLKWDAKLSDIEERVARQAIYGHTHDEVAEIFHHSHFTITNTIRRAFRKTGARNIAELAAWFWCKDFHVTLIISDGKRKIIALAFLLLIAFSEVCTLSSNARSFRARAKANSAYSIKASRGRKNELDNYIDYLIEL